MKVSAIYHYCSLKSFFKIIKSKSVWLSGINNMNDYHEVEWTKNKVRKILNELETMYEINDITQIWDNFILNNSLPFIFSLSKNGDLLSQWRAYSDDGRGVAIGFNQEFFPVVNHLPHNNASSKNTLGLWEVLYDEKKQKKILEKVLKDALNNMKSDKKNRENYIPTAVYELKGYSILFKNPAFEEEHEWRLIHTPLILGDNDNNTKVHGGLSEIEHRVSNNKICSYFDLGFDVVGNGKDPIIEVILGPKCAVTDFDISVFLSVNDCKSVKVKRSNASYR